jgi:tetratricopeptide (TPR) repeat protein
VVVVSFLLSCRPFPKLQGECAVSLVNLARLHHESGQYELAINLLRQAEDIQELVLPRLHPNRAMVLNALGNSLSSSRHYTDAITCFKRAAAVLEAFHQGRTDADMLAVMKNLAEAYVASGDLLEAVECFTDVVKGMMSLYPEGHASLETVEARSEDIMAACFSNPALKQQWMYRHSSYVPSGLSVNRYPVEKRSKYGSI